MRTLLRTVPFGVFAILLSMPARAQSDAPVGVRAAGMGGAFVAVSDDASAVFWNPAGLASGSYFSLVLDRNGVKTADDAEDPRSRSGLLVALGTPPVGVTYFRTRVVTRGADPVSLAAGVRPGDGTVVRLQNLIAHHTGVTLVHTIARGVSVGATLKLVRGVASAIETVRDVDLAAADDLIGRASNKLDADFGIMAESGPIKAGLAVRNAFEPAFAVAGNGPAIVLERRIRGGVAFRMAPSLTVAADADFTRVATSGGRWRDAAVGGEARLTRRAWARAGVHWNTAGDERPGSAPVASAGATYLIFGSILADGQVSFGSGNGDRGWGLGTRIVF